jgi:hypothetical protein
MRKQQQPATKVVVRVVTVNGQTWRGEGRTEAEAFARMQRVGVGR